MNKRNMLLIIPIFICSIICCAPSEKSKENAIEKKYSITIDWLPSPEYYGFYYAKKFGIYKRDGLDVEIVNSTGAPEAAALLGAGKAYAVTSTSDNILRLLSKNVKLSRITPIFKFNPSVLVSLKDNPIKNIDDIKGKKIGVNVMASVYKQFLYLLRIKGINPNQFTEYPIGYGGANELKGRKVDGILAYTTNIVVDLELENVKINEIFFGEEKVSSLGLILAFADVENLKRNNITESNVQAFIDATLEGYKKGLVDIQGSINALKEVAPTLNEKKISAAIRKIGNLNRVIGIPSNEIDVWIDDVSITKEIRELFFSLIK
jgi:ABC-type nitrate/sulfonate/bicarbonate transport system substrate-binding protein